MCRIMGQATPWLLLILFFAIAYLVPLNDRLLWMPDETRYAEISREMLQQREWVVPKLLGHRYFEKPIAGYWWNALSQWLFGENRFAVRFASALSTGLSAWLVYHLANRVWCCRHRAITASLVYLSLLLVYGIGTYAVLDGLMSFWVTLALSSAYGLLTAAKSQHQRLAAIVLGGAAGMAFLTKGFVAGAIIAVTLLPYFIWQSGWNRLFRQTVWIVGSFLLVTLPWVIAIAQREPDYWHYFFWVEHIQRFSSEQAQHRAPCWFYLPLLLLGSLPWLGFLPSALWLGWQRRNSDPSCRYRYFLCWFLGPFILLSFAKGKLLTYILPCFAPLALLIGNRVVEAREQGAVSPFHWNTLLNFLFSLLCCGIIGFHQQLLPHEPLYVPGERATWLIALFSFAGWGVLALFSWFQPLKRWWMTATCPVLLGWLLAYALPQSIINTKWPEAFLKRHQHWLSQSDILVSNDVALAVGAGWQLKREDLLLVGDPGELRYGINYSDSRRRYLTVQQFPEWLSEARLAGNIALLLHLNEDGLISERWPKADRQWQNHRFALLYYQRQLASDPA
ncbi:MAG: lipid IV(A) 4-amino-4-deoxy-L-arabinosyltransferase [Candidatus Symbiodolus clandestinus]